MGPVTYKTVEDIKALRKQIDAVMQVALLRGTSHDGPKDSENERLYDMADYQVYLKLTDAKMWAGKMLEGLGSPSPPELADKAQ